MSCGSVRVGNMKKLFGILTVLVCLSAPVAKASDYQTTWGFILQNEVYDALRCVTSAYTGANQANITCVVVGNAASCSVDMGWLGTWVTYVSGHVSGAYWRSDTFTINNGNWGSIQYVYQQQPRPGVGGTVYFQANYTFPSGNTGLCTISRMNGPTSQAIAYWHGGW